MNLSTSWPGLSRPSTPCWQQEKGVDARHIGERSDAVLRTAMPGHDELKVRSRLVVVRHRGVDAQQFAQRRWIAPTKPAFGSDRERFRIFLRDGEALPPPGGPIRVMH